MAVGASPISVRELELAYDMCLYDWEGQEVILPQS